MLNAADRAIWRALGHPLRRRVLDLLREGAQTTGALAERFPSLSRFAVMQHLGVLEKANLVLVRRAGRERFNHLNPAPIQRIYDRWMSRYAQRLAGPASALKDFVEQEVVRTSGESGGIMAKKNGNAATPGEFRVATVEVEFTLNAPRAKVWKALTQQVASWWPKSFCMKPEQVKAFRVEFQLGGRMYEDWGGGEGWVWWNIVQIDSPRYFFTCQGVLSDVSSWDFVTFSLEERRKATVLKISDRMWGNMPKKYERRHEDGWKVLFDGAFKPFVEK